MSVRFGSYRGIGVSAVLGENVDGEEGKVGAGGGVGGDVEMHEFPDHEIGGGGRVFDNIHEDGRHVKTHASVLDNPTGYFATTGDVLGLVALADQHLQLGANLPDLAAELGHDRCGVAGHSLGKTEEMGPIIMSVEI